MTPVSLPELAASAADGDVVALGGKTLHRAPMALVRELVRADVGELTLVGLANSMDVDLLCATGGAAAVHYGYVGFEAFGLAPNFRREVEAGAVDPLEGTCYTVATMLRGAKQGVPFLPVAGLDGSDLLTVGADRFADVEGPFTGERTYAVRSVRPDVAAIHATEVDAEGNVRCEGADLTEGLLARAADRVLVTAERVHEETFDAPERTVVPGFLVDSVAEVPYGAHPCSCPGAYDYDGEHLEYYLSASRAGEFGRYREAYLAGDEAAYRERAIEGEEERLAWPAEATLA